MEQQPTLESLSRKIDSIQALLMKALDLLSNEKEQQIRKKEEKDVIREMPPIRNSDAAGLLQMSTRQLQRVRKTYKLKWERRGREVYYFLTPIISAIRIRNLRWNRQLLEKLLAGYRQLP